MTTVLLVALGAAVGAPIRYLVNELFNARQSSAFPWATLVVNGCGSFILGALSVAALDSQWFSLLGTGLCGALTTYSTFSYETLRLVEGRLRGLALLNAVAAVVVSLAAAALGMLGASALV